MEKFKDFLEKKKFYIYLVAIIASNNLWFMDTYGSWFLTFGILLTMPILGLNFLLGLFLIVIDGIFKLVSFYFAPELLAYYPVYLVTILGVVSALSYALNRTGKERRELISTLHKLKNEAADLESSTSEAISRISGKGKTSPGLAGLIQEREDSYKNILNIIKKNFHPYSIVLYLSSISDSSFYMREYISESENIKTDPVRYGEGMLYAVFKERRTVNIRKCKQSQYMIPYYEKDEGVQSMLAIPLLSGKRLKGILCLDSLRPERFSTAEEEIIGSLSKELVKAIDSSEAMRGFARMKDELLHVCELGTRLNNNLDQTQTIDVLMDISKKFINYDFACFVSFDPETGKNKIIRINTLDEKVYEGRDFSCDDKLGLSSWVIRNQVPLEYCQIKGKGKEIILFNKNFKIPFKYNSVLILPIKSHHNVLGAFIIASKRGHICREDDKKMLEGVCSQIGIAFDNARMYETLKHFATIDGLTGLNNHRIFQETLAQEVARHERHPEKFSLILLDIDHFKGFNDTYGHPIGDFVLREISSILQSMVRKVDMAARYGGEEFALILLNTDQSGALKMAERIRQKVESQKFKKDKLSLKVTISLGVSTYPDSAMSKPDLIETADKALYLAKESGRNQSVHFDAYKHQLDKYKIAELKKAQKRPTVN